MAKTKAPRIVSILIVILAIALIVMGIVGLNARGSDAGSG